MLTMSFRIFFSRWNSIPPRHFESLLGMSKPTKASELQQLHCATNWMRNSIPEYAKVIAPLHTLMEDAYSKAGKRTKQAVRKISLTNEWGAIHDDAFTHIKSQLAASVKLAHPKPDHTMCLFTDASNTHWGAVLTKVPNAQRREELERQHHEPLCFLSGAFKGASANWSVSEKEGFAIVESMCRLDYLIFGHTVSIYTDHANLVYMYDPFGRNPGISRQTASKLMRWAIKLSAFRFKIESYPVKGTSGLTCLHVGLFNLRKRSKPNALSISNHSCLHPSILVSNPPSTGQLGATSSKPRIQPTSLLLGHS